MDLSGGGPGTATFVWIPGLLSDRSVWQPIAQAIGPGAIHYFAEVTAGVSMTAMAQSILDDSSGPLFVVGHSMGGRIALEMARLAPERVTGLVLVNTGYQPAGDGEEIKRQAMVDLGHDSMEKLADAWLPPMLDPARLGDIEILHALRAMVMRAGADVHERQIRALVDRPDAGAYLSTIECPLLLITGRQDNWSPIAQHQEIAGLVAGSRLVVIENAGHFAPVEQPHAVGAAIAEWLRNHGGKLETAYADNAQIPETPLFDRALSIKGYRMNKMAMALSQPANREAFKADEEAYLSRFKLSEEEKSAVLSRNWHEMVRLGGNLFFILKISAIDPTPITMIGAAQAGMEHDAFLSERLGKVVQHG